MAQRKSGYAREPDDVYETPAWVTRVVVPYLRECTHIWDPSDGPASKIAAALREAGFKVTATNNDFLSTTELPAPDIGVIATNPPYGADKSGKKACAFIRHALELVPRVFMLLRIDFDSGRTRTALFRDCPSFAGKIVLLDRIVWFERAAAAGPSDNHAWYYWDRRHCGPPTIRYARRQ